MFYCSIYIYVVYWFGKEGRDAIRKAAEAGDEDAAEKVKELEG